MKKIFVFLTVLMLGMASFNQVNALPFQTKPAQHLKKDGTPDKRFKANKKPAGPLKKDGTADMRYKANKKATPKKH
ncbi:hypothetical protein [Mucilaginibacter sp.]|uniref:hypothetical protein n=1 Tax=Mucilaginibacter sp. TaxID=1882438 RepID=UPI003D0FBF9B